jgi:Nif-specific regulatory protein
VRIYRAGTILTGIAPPPEQAADASPAPAAPDARTRPPASRAEYLKGLEREELHRALENSGWVIARAAKLLGWTPRQVGYKMRKYALESPWKKPA